MGNWSPIEGVDFFVRLVDFPAGCGCDGMVLPNDDGKYSVYLDARRGYYAQRIAMRHEYDHMANDDLYSGGDIRDIERL